MTIIRYALFFDWLNNRVAFRKICFPYFARDKWSDHDFENVLKSDSWLGSEKSQILRQWLEIGVFRGYKTASAFYNLLLPDFARDEWFNHDYENCSEISALTWFIIFPGLLHFPTFMFFTPPYFTLFILFTLLPALKLFTLLALLRLLTLVVLFISFTLFTLFTLFILLILLTLLTLLTLHSLFKKLSIKRAIIHPFMQKNK